MGSTHTYTPHDINIINTLYNNDDDGGDNGDFYYVTIILLLLLIINYHHYYCGHYGCIIYCTEEYIHWYKNEMSPIKTWVSTTLSSKR